MKNSKSKTILVSIFSLLSAPSCNWSSDSVFGRNPEEVEVREEGYSYGGGQNGYSCTTSRSELIASTTLFDEPGRSCSNPNGALGGAKINADGNLLVWVYEMEDGKFPAVLDVQYQVDNAVIRFGTCTNREDTLVEVTPQKRGVMSTSSDASAPVVEVVQPAPTPSPDPTTTYKKMREILCTPTVTTSKIAGATKTVTAENDPTTDKDDDYEITVLALKNEACESTATYKFAYKYTNNVPCGAAYPTVGTTIKIGEIQVPRFVWANVPGI